MTSMDGVRKHLLKTSQPEHLVFIGEEGETGEFYPKMVSIGSSSNLFTIVTSPYSLQKLLC